MAKTVRLVRIGNTPEVVTVDDSATVEDVLRQSGLDGVSVYSNGVPLNPNDSIDPDATLTIIPQVKGG